jgi:methionine-rich copper-binding protein CopC
MRYLYRAAVLAMALPAGPAAAHAILVDSSPAPYAHLPAGSVAMVLRYNSRIDAARSKLTLVHGDDETRLTTDDAGKPDMLHATVNLAPGEYTIKWQVLATDGHITRGSVPFTVAGAAH